MKFHASHYLPLRLLLGDAENVKAASIDFRTKPQAKVRCCRCCCCTLGPRLLPTAAPISPPEHAPLPRACARVRNAAQRLLLATTTTSRVDAAIRRQSPIQLPKVKQHTGRDRIGGRYRSMLIRCQTLCQYHTVQPYITGLINYGPCTIQTLSSN